MGAKWRNEKIELLDGTTGRFLEGSKLQNKEIIGGKGVRRKIDDINRLVKEYPGSSFDGWMKVKAVATVILPDDEIVTMKVHWCEHEAVEKKNSKRKGDNMKVVVNEEKRKLYNAADQSTVDLIPGKQYEVIEKKEVGMYYKRYKILDESGECFLYPQALFDIIEE